jgi:nucleotide-binding universal stress UspA family protein
VTGYSLAMTRVMIAVDGSELDAPLARTAHRLFGAHADYWAVNVRGDGAIAPGAIGSTLPATYNTTLIGFGGVFPYVAPDPSRVRAPADDGGAGTFEDVRERADATARSAVDEAGLPGAGRVAELGDPPEAILRAARDHDIDVIVVGDHDRSWWSKLFAPAVGSELIDRAEIPVLVVSRDAADPSPAKPEVT